MSAVPYQQLADAVLALHVLIVVFVVLGLVLTVVGNICRWNWVNNLQFRIFHLLAIAIVVAESWFGITCPFTILESWLRSLAQQATYQSSFIEHWLSQLLSYEAPGWMFTLAYSMFGVLAILSWWFYPPRVGTKKG